MNPSEQKCCEKCKCNGKHTYSGMSCACHNPACECHIESNSIPPQSQELDESTMAELIERYDFHGIAKAFSDGNVKWHTKEWREFISKVRLQTLKEVRKVVEGIEGVCSCGCDPREHLREHNIHRRDILTSLTTLENKEL